MKIQNLTYRAQIFAASLLLIIPSIVLGIITANQNAHSIAAEYNETLDTILTQTDLTLDTLLNDAIKIADIHILNDDIRKAMITDYSDDLLSYARDSDMILQQISQTNRLNTNVISCLFKNRYDFTFQYNLLNETERQLILRQMEEWSDLARDSAYHTYFGPVQKSRSSGGYLLPMVKILYDGYTFREIGACYVGIRFSSVEEIFNSAKTGNNTLFIYNAQGDLIYLSDESFSQDPEKSQYLSRLQRFSESITEEHPGGSDSFSRGNTSLLVNGCYNQTTGWKIIQFVDDQTITQAYRKNLVSYGGIFLLTAFLEMLLAFFLSRSLTRSIQILCEKVDAKNLDNYADIVVDSRISNRELQKLVDSFNHLNKRLAESIQKNYVNQLNEQSMKIQMLQTQINHHFLYNTLNSITSLAEIHDVPEIKTISMSMSELLRYNLKKVPIVRLEEEIQQVNRYLAILTIRFPDKFQLDWNIPRAFYDLEIPAFLLQPLIENSVEHGFAEKETDCYISISLHLENNILHFFVADNGLGIEPERLRLLNLSLSQMRRPEPGYTHHFIGLLNVHQRIRGYYGEEYGLTVESSPGEGTIVEIRLPYNRRPQLPSDPLPL